MQKRLKFRANSYLSLMTEIKYDNVSLRRKDLVSLHRFTVSKLKEIPRSWLLLIRRFFYNLSVLNSLQPSYKISLTLIKILMGSIRLVEGPFDLWSSSSFVSLLFLSSSAHQAGKVKVSLFRSGRWHKNCLETNFQKLLSAITMDLRSLKSVFVIAEIWQNHQGDIRVAKEVIKFSVFAPLAFNLINFI